MTGRPGIANRLAVQRRSLVVAVLGLAMAGGALSYTLKQSAMPPAPVVQVPAGADRVQAALRLGKPAVVEFGGSACAGCREMKPILEALAREHGDHVTVLDIDVLKAREYISRYKIRLLPTQVFFDAQGDETGRNMGPISASGVLVQLGVPSTGRSP
jgi:thioredoxin 1